ncbi:hypothetical protein HDU97_009711 [Phlyctochytrium planicorne]|nr:hypothetical protein HDU97_009711 [Phlyctochytrium planicorne]
MLAAIVGKHRLPPSPATSPSIPSASSTASSSTTFDAANAISRTSSTISSAATSQPLPPTRQPSTLSSTLAREPSIQETIATPSLPTKLDTSAPQTIQETPSSSHKNSKDASNLGENGPGPLYTSGVIAVVVLVAVIGFVLLMKARKRRREEDAWDREECAGEADGDVHGFSFAVKGEEDKVGKQRVCTDDELEKGKEVEDLKEGNDREVVSRKSISSIRRKSKPGPLKEKLDRRMSRAASLSLHRLNTVVTGTVAAELEDEDVGLVCMSESSAGDDDDVDDGEDGLLLVAPPPPTCRSRRSSVTDTRRAKDTSPTFVSPFEIPILQIPLSPQRLTPSKELPMAIDTTFQNHPNSSSPTPPPTTTSSNNRRLSTTPSTSTPTILRRLSTHSLTRFSRSPSDKNLKLALDMQREHDIALETWNSIQPPLTPQSMQWEVLEVLEG